MLHRVSRFPADAGRWDQAAPDVGDGGAHPQRPLSWRSGTVRPGRCGHGGNRGPGGGGPQPCAARLGLVRQILQAARPGRADGGVSRQGRSEEHTSELQSLMRISYAVFCLKKKKTKKSASRHTKKPTKTNRIHMKM